MKVSTVLLIFVSLLAETVLRSSSVKVEVKFCGRNQIKPNKEKKFEAFCNPDLTPHIIKIKTRKCICKPGFVRNAWDQCVPIRDCLTCREWRNQDFRLCHPPCTLVCDKPIPAGCSKRRPCTNGCQCTPGFIRTPSIHGRCIPIIACPPRCHPGAGFSYCLTACDRNKSCSTPRLQHCSTRCLGMGCRCKEGFLRLGRRCVRANQCLKVNVASRIASPLTASGRVSTPVLPRPAQGPPSPGVSVSRLSPDDIRRYVVSRDGGRNRPATPLPPPRSSGEAPPREIHAPNPTPGWGGSVTRSSLQAGPIHRPRVLTPGVGSLKPPAQAPGGSFGGIATGSPGAPDSFSAKVDILPPKAAQ